MPDPAGRRRNLSDVAVTLALAAAYFVYLLIWVRAPDLFAALAIPALLVPWGMVGGALLIVLIMAAAGAYMAVRNGEADEDPGQ